MLIILNNVLRLRGSCHAIQPMMVLLWKISEFQNSKGYSYSRLISENWIEIFHIFITYKIMLMENINNIMQFFRKFLEIFRKWIPS